jgi:hypothetical protein
MTTDDGVVYREVIELQATPAQIREFIMTPERLVDYNPGAVDCGVFEPGHAVWFRTEQNVVMIERVEDDCRDDCVVVRATVAPGLVPPFTPDDVRAGQVMNLMEDWDLEEIPDGTITTETWRDVVTVVELPFDVEDGIRELAKTETAPIIEKWNAAARLGSG